VTALPGPNPIRVYHLHHLILHRPTLSRAPM